MKNLKVKKVVKKVVEVATIVGLTLSINNVMNSTDTTKELKLNDVNNVIIENTNNNVNKELILKNNNLKCEEIVENIKKEINNILKDTNITILDDYFIKKGNIFFELSNNSTVLYDTENNTIEFYIEELEDWNYVFNDFNDFKNCFITYINNTSDIFIDIDDTEQKENTNNLTLNTEDI